MKYILMICFWMSITLVGIQAQPRVEFNKKTHDFGAVLWKNPVTATFQIRNIGNKPLVISNVTTSCGCTDAQWTQSPIAPGAEGIITSTFDAMALGRFQKTIGVYCNADYRPIYLTLCGQVTTDPRKVLQLPYRIGDIKLDKDAIEFDDANKGDRPFVELLVANVSGQPYPPVLMHLPPYLSAEATLDTLAHEGYGKIKVTLDTEKLPKFGVTQAVVYLSRFPGDKVSDENAIPVSAVLLPDFSRLTSAQLQNPPVIHLSATHLDFGTLAVNEKKSQTIVISNTGKRDLEITDLQVLDGSVGVHLKKRVLKPGTNTKLKITAYGRQFEDRKRSPRILIITNDPNHPKQIVNVSVTSK